MSPLNLLKVGWIGSWLILAEPNTSTKSGLGTLMATVPLSSRRNYVNNSESYKMCNVVH